MIHVFGIRHHGPGCARALRSALDALRPDAVLVEGPPDAEEVLPLIAGQGMVPPVALLIYPVEEPRRAVYYPFAGFSPEWQALRWGFEHGVPVRFMDLPQTHQLGLEQSEEKTGEETEPDAETPAEEPEDSEPEEVLLHEDPIGLLSEAAGYTDRELWWEHQIEQRRDAAGLFEGILEAMGELRSRAPEPDRREAQREAFMRQRIRAAQKEGFERIAVVCGAWHAPVLAVPGPAKTDQALLKDLPKTKVAATWIPWTHSRLSYRSGYGAGVASPGWYQHLWASPDRAPIRWVAQAARLLREEDLDASPASVIETVRLAETLAVLRDLPMPGLRELNESVQAVLCQGDTAPLALIRERLEIGDALGEVPDEAPALPLQKDLEAQQRRLRLKPSTEIRELDLDLREETGRARSHLLHRLRLLGIPWGEPGEAARRSTGTFHEVWRIVWQPEFAVRVIESSLWGNTVEEAAGAFAAEQGRKAEGLPELTDLLDRAILAGLPAAVESLLADLQARAAVSADVRHMMDALPALARVARYGDVRETRAADVLPVVRGLFERLVVSLPGACSSLDDAAASGMADSLANVQSSIDMLDLADLRDEWREALDRLANLEGAHGLVRGYACRLLVDQRVLGPEELSRRARLSLSPAVPPRDAAGWIEGLLRGSGLLLLHHDSLWGILDEWLAGLSPDIFKELLALLRRAFSSFQGPERRKMGEKVKTLRQGGSGAVPTEAAGLDRERADRVLPVLAQILGAPILEKTDG